MQIFVPGYVLLISKVHISENQINEVIIRMAKIRKETVVVIKIVHVAIIVFLT